MIALFYGYPGLDGLDLGEVGIADYFKADRTGSVRTCQSMLPVLSSFGPFTRQLMVLLVSSSHEKELMLLDVRLSDCSDL